LQFRNDRPRRRSIISIGDIKYRAQEIEFEFATLHDNIRTA
jgi:hypothetical protein